MGSLELIIFFNNIFFKKKVINHSFPKYKIYINYHVISSIEPKDIYSFLISKRKGNEG